MLNETSEKKSSNLNIFSSADSLSIFGVWLFILSDGILFSALFVAYVVLQHNTVGGPGIRDIASIPYVYLQTLILLVSNYLIGRMIINYRNEKVSKTVIYSAVIAILGIVFVAFQAHEYSMILSIGYSWKSSAFMSAYFSLTGILMIHFIVGIVWLALNVLQMLMKAPKKFVQTRFASFVLYWHFLTVIWLMVFIIVYLMGAI